MTSSTPSTTAANSQVLTGRATTRPQLQPLTTPFIPPANCTDRYNTTMFTSSGYGITSTTILEVRASIPSLNPTCQPTGWNLTDTIRTFRPAVCPGGWTAYDLGVRSTSSSPDYSEVLISTAHCCSSGFTYTYLPYKILNEYGNYCAQQIKVPYLVDEQRNSISYTNNDLTTLFVLYVHYPWTIAWAASDTSTLSPTPPTLLSCTNTQIPTWIPGETVAPGARNPCYTYEPQPQPRGDGSEGYLRMLSIVIPISTIFCISVCSWYWCCRSACKKDRREMKRLRREARDRELLAAEAATEAAAAEATAAPGTPPPNYELVETTSNTNTKQVENPGNSTNAATTSNIM